MAEKSKNEYENIISDVDSDLFDIEGLEQALDDVLQDLLEPLEDKETVAELNDATVKILIYGLVRENKTLIALINAIYTQTKHARERLQ